jgi:hypothetical protein
MNEMYITIEGHSNHKINYLYNWLKERSSDYYLFEASIQSNRINIQANFMLNVDRIGEPGLGIYVFPENGNCIRILLRPKK